jgi:hypothetical protein
MMKKMMKRIKLANGGELLESSEDGSRFWFLNDRLHREDGPAIEYYSGRKDWYINGKYHRKDGPAIEFANGDKSWYLNDIQILCKTQKQFEQLMRLKAFW